MDITWQFYCCQPEPEKALSFGLATAFAASLFAPVPTAPFDAVWLGVTKSQVPRKESFDLHYRVAREVVIDPITELPVEVFVCLDPLWYGGFLIFLATAEASCPNGCTLKSWP